MLCMGFATCLMTAYKDFWVLCPIYLRSRKLGGHIRAGFYGFRMHSQHRYSGRWMDR